MNKKIQLTLPKSRSQSLPASAAEAIGHDHPVRQAQTASSHRSTRPTPAFNIRILLVAWSLSIPSMDAATLLVPEEFAGIRQALEAARSGDIVQVSPGRYEGPLKIGEGVTLRSQGTDQAGVLGLVRAERTIVDGKQMPGPGVTLGKGAVLDGFTITGFGTYDPGIWQHHHETQGREQSHESVGAPGQGGVWVKSGGRVLYNLIHHNGYTGIAVQGGLEGDEGDVPILLRNTCYRNMGGGIGAMQGTRARIEQNHCFENFHAGIGMHGAHPLVIDNECHHNIRAGIGISDGSCPEVRGNHCHHNRRAGIGIRTSDTTRPLVEDNRCIENDMAGIGVEEEAHPRLLRNLIRGNGKVAIGIQGGAVAVVVGNRLQREGGVPPMIAVLKGSRAEIRENVIQGGGVAALLVQGHAEVSGNRFQNLADRKPGATQAAVWAHKGSDLVFENNEIVGWPRGVNTRSAHRVHVLSNRILDFRGVAIVVQDSSTPARIEGNVVDSKDPQARILEASGPMDPPADNRFQSDRLQQPDKEPS